MALKGIKVVEFAGLAPAPFCGMILADFGASVIRIDKGNANTDLDTLGNGKKSLAVNLKSPDAVNIVKKLLRTSDVSIDPFRAGVMERLGLGPEVLLKENPKLIYARLTGYGQSGPYSKKAGHDINYLALSGLLSLFGRKHENPMFPVNFAADFAGGGLTCALGIVMALFEREKSGRGQIVDCSMVKGTTYVGSFLYRTQNLPMWGNKRGENVLDSGAAFYEVYKTKDDKYISVGALELQFYQELLRGLGISEEEAPQFDVEKNKELFAKKFAEKTRDEWVKIFESLDACVAPVLELDEAQKYDHNVQQNTFSKESNAPNPAPDLSRTPAISTSALKRPIIGEHTVQILQDIGYETKDIINFKKTGIIHFPDSSKL